MIKDNINTMIMDAMKAHNQTETTVLRDIKTAIMNWETSKENVGKTFSAKSISDYLKSEHRSIDNETVYNYLEKLESAYILHRCSRYDVQGKELLKTQELMKFGLDINGKRELGRKLCFIRALIQFRRR
jgi:predicted AAA+ superfamily ATPase